MSDNNKIHPYLQDLEENKQSNVFWNTNAHFPLNHLLDRESDEANLKVKKVEKQKEMRHEKSVAERREFVGDIDALSPFSQWLISLKPASPGNTISQRQYSDDLSKKENQELSSIEPEKKKKKKKKKAQLKAANALRKSALLEKDIVSETLAELISGQGHTEEAIEMYRKLMNLYPDKAAHYIQRISDLRQGKL